MNSLCSLPVFRHRKRVFLLSGLMEINKTKIKMKLTKLTITGALTVAIALGLYGREKLPDLNVDDTDLDREGKVLTSFAPVIKDVRKSVVSIETTVKPTIRNTGYRSPFFDDPLFNEFFGDPYRGQPMPSERLQRGLGSGVIVSSNGFIITNNHVVDGADTIEVELTHSKKKYSAEVVGADPGTDIAVLKIEAVDLPAVTFTDSDKIEIGDIVMAIGNPLGVGQSVTMGIVGATGRSDLRELQIDYQSFIQTDAAINRGNSGGALVDAYGRLIGINTAIASPSGGSDGLGFAIPSNLARSVMSTLIQNGKMVRGFLGVTISDVSSDLSDYYDLEEAKGTYIESVRPNSPADKAGLKDGDIVVAVDGIEIADKDSFRARIAQTLPGKIVNLDILRNGDQKSIKAELGELNEQAMARVTNPFDPWSNRESPKKAKNRTKLDGLSASDLNSALRQQRGIPQSFNGVIVTGIKEGSDVASTELAVGDIILAVNQIPIEKVADINKSLASSRNGKVLIKVLTVETGYRGVRHILVKTK